jgi:hypothetical protein
MAVSFLCLREMIEQYGSTGSRLSLYSVIEIKLEVLKYYYKLLGHLRYLGSTGFYSSPCVTREHAVTTTRQHTHVARTASPYGQAHHHLE